MRDMLYHAYQNSYAVGAFEIVNLEFLEDIIATAERCRSPVILSITESNLDYFDFEITMPAVETAARRASVPIVIHLEHAANLNSAVRGINLGCNSISVTASHHTTSENIRITRKITEMAHTCGIPVEGKLPGGSIYTATENAKCYVEQTGIDFLAASFDTAHNPVKGLSKLNDQQLEQINQTMGIPLAINGDLPYGDDQLKQFIAIGAAKINYYRTLPDIIDSQIRSNAKNQLNCGYSDLLKGVREVINTEVERCMCLLGSIGQATELLVHCTPWAPVEHVIIYNVSGISEHGADAMMAEGQRILSTIPGVRKVVTGKAVKEAAEYRYCWLVTFVHPAVINSYREHPAHVAFADNLFRPVASERISIDYQTSDNRVPCQADTIRRHSTC